MSTPISSLQVRPAGFYYLDNFRSALQWLRDRYADLLSEDENRFIHEFGGLPLASQALLVRLIMRKGPHFRGSRISYTEIGSIEHAVVPLVSLHWIDPNPLLTLDDLFKLITRAEVAEIFPQLPAWMSKVQALQALRETHDEPRLFQEWRGSVAERVYFVAVTFLCTRLRLLFFGNFRQDWSEFVLADLGIYKYEAVGFSPASRAFHCRQDIEDFFALYECRRRLHEESSMEDVLTQLPATNLNHEWLESRRAKLIFTIARQYERSGERDSALNLYLKCNYPGARLRAIRTLETAGRHHDARELALAASASPESAAEAQRLGRIISRLERHLNFPRREVHRPARAERLDLIVPRTLGKRVEQVAREHLEELAAPVYYVENTLVNSLFGLLCWDAIFAPLSGAFFHPFHFGPADLYSPTFRARRKHMFDRCLRQLESGDYRTSIRETFDLKYGTQSPFVSWGLLSEELLDTALACLPPVHLRGMFERLLGNLNENRSGLPDLVQFWPEQRSYRMIEVKGPGDRLQDNQQRWIEFCIQSEIPVAVCHVRWA
jgi:VRR-NUC domain/Fanconi anemia-associated nuclease SAP domain